MENIIVDNSNTGVRSNHDLGFNWMGTSDFGRLTPFHCEELIPTDKVVRCRPRIEMQMLPLASPTFGQMDLYVHYFFVPTRLIWQDSSDFFSESGVNSAAVPPYWTVSDFKSAYGRVSGDPANEFTKHWTSLGYSPTWLSSGTVSSVNDVKLSTLPLRAYNQVWWDYYRDAELISDASKSSYLVTSSGRDSTAALDIKYVPRVRTLTHNWFSDLFSTNGSMSPFPYYAGLQTGSGTNPVGVNSDSSYSVQTRTIEALTRIAERMSLSGKRQIDRLFAKYGVKPMWNKLNMCQYIGGSKATVLISDITATASGLSYGGSGSSGEDVSVVPLGQKAGAGYAALSDLNITYQAQEPGYLIGMFSVMPHVHFVQGIDKKFIRNSVNDFYRRELEHTGQVAVARREIAVNGVTNVYDSSKDGETFAFTQPYYDYKHHADVLSGDFIRYFGNTESSDSVYLKSLGMYVTYPEARTYNSENMQVPSEASQVFYYQGGSIWSGSDDHFQLNISIDCMLNRPMDGYAVPTIETTEDPHKSATNIRSTTTL